MKTDTGTFTSFDGKALFYREWEHDAPFNGRILFILHRGHEHSERLQNIAAQKAFEGYKIFSYDNRGHGHTQEGATYAFMNLVRDLDAFVAFVLHKEQKKQEDVFIIANSVAGVVASTWVHDYAPNIKGMALVAPAFKIKLYFPFAKALLKAALYFKPDLNIKSYVKSKFLTHDYKEQKRYDADALITPNIPAKQLTTLLDTAQRVVADAALMTTPTLVLSATHDYVVSSKIQGDFYAALSSKIKRFVPLEGFFHGVLYEVDHQYAIDAIADFIALCFETETATEEEKSIEAVVRITQNERDKIAFGSLSCFKETAYFLQRTMMKYLGGLSKGIRIGMQYGFDSGVTLDHVYKNEPEGTMWIGKLIDKNYLQSIGWKGIRQRKVHMIAAVEEKIALLREAGEKVSILDIAGGPARYLIEIAANYPDIEVTVRDYQEQNVTEGRALAEKLGLQNIIYEQCNAFERQNYARKALTPNIVIISGVFELFGDNALIGNAIDGVASIIADDGYLLYTGQPWHPQLEQIANVLGNHQNEKWIMRRRSQYELDRLFALRGFEKEKMRIDDWGIFTVSTAKMGQKES
jgi:alpha-beta hydrolase superfamily lysophospholipase